MGLKKFLIVLAVSIILLLVLAAWFLPLDEDFRVENPYWNGSRDLNTDYPVQPLDSFTNLPASPRGTTLIVVPYLKLTPEELEQLERFVGGGGRLILADDYGHGNQVTEHLGLKAGFSGEILMIPLPTIKTPISPRLFTLNPIP